MVAHPFHVYSYKIWLLPKGKHFSHHLTEGHKSWQVPVSLHVETLSWSVVTVLAWAATGPGFKPRPGHPSMVGTL